MTWAVVVTPLLKKCGIRFCLLGVFSTVWQLMTLTTSMILPRKAFPTKQPPQQFILPFQGAHQSLCMLRNYHQRKSLQQLIAVVFTR